MKKKISSNLKIYTILMLFGGALYCLAELMFRGRTHPSMWLCGGICISFVYLVSVKLNGANIFKLAFISCIIITTTELVFGYIFNILLLQNVWDYTALKGNFLGQICIPFSIIWFIASIPSIYACRFIEKCFN